MRSSKFFLPFLSLIKTFTCAFLLLVFAACSSDDGSETPVAEPVLVPLFACENGLAGTYPCDGYDLMGRMDVQSLSGTFDAGVNDSWGWTDPDTGKEYALVGNSTGTAFVDISNPTNPVLAGRLPTATVNSSWRDIKVYRNYAFIVSEATGHGMQVFDLKKLRSISNPPQNFTADARYTAFGDAHNLVINEDSGFAYVVGSDTFEGGPHFIDIRDPLNPVPAGGYAADHYSHDAQVVIYNGPDTDYSGREIFVGSNHDAVVIVDVTDKASPVKISGITYNDFGFPHQGWFTEDLKYFIAGDETDELTFNLNSRSLVLDFTDLDDPKLHLEYLGPSQAIDHNGYVKGDLFYLANYTAGLRIIDLGGLDNSVMNEVGFFDTYPLDDSRKFNGAWNVYPFFESGNIVVSDIEGGLFIIRKSGT